MERGNEELGRGEADEDEALEEGRRAERAEKDVRVAIRRAAGERNDMLEIQTRGAVGVGSNEAGGASTVGELGLLSTRRFDLCRP